MFGVVVTLNVPPSSSFVWHWLAGFIVQAQRLFSRGVLAGLAGVGSLVVLALMLGYVPADHEFDALAVVCVVCGMATGGALVDLLSTNGQEGLRRLCSYVNVATRLQYGFGRSSSIRVNLRIPARPVVVAWCEIILASAVKVWFLGLLMGLAMLGLAVLVLVAAVADPYELAVLMLRVWAVGLGLWTVAEFAWSVVQNARGSCPQCGALPNIPRAEEGPCAA